MRVYNADFKHPENGSQGVKPAAAAPQASLTAGYSLHPLRDGSLYVCKAQNFRTKRRKRASGTEVSRCIGHKTSVPKAENGPRGWKSACAQGIKLPYQVQKTGLGYGSRQVLRA